MEKYRLFKTKFTFTFGMYWLFWRHSVQCSLRDDYGWDIDPGHELLMGFVPVYGAILWYRFLKRFRDFQVVTGVPKSISVGRAFWLSGGWFGCGPYLNHHINALYTFRAGRTGTSPTTVPVAA